MYLDEYTQVQQAIVKALQCYQCVTTVVVASHILDLTQKQWANWSNIAEQAPSTGDLPQIIVLCDDESKGLKAWTSQADSDSCDYRIVLAVDVGSQLPINDLRKRVLVALRAYQEQFRCFGLSAFVYKVTLKGCKRGGMNRESWARGSLRWFDVMKVTADFYFPRGENTVALANGYPPPANVTT